MSKRTVKWSYYHPIDNKRYDNTESVDNAKLFEAQKLNWLCERENKTASEVNKYLTFKYLT